MILQIIYNLALAYHKCAVVTPAPSASPASSASQTTEAGVSNQNIDSTDFASTSSASQTVLSMSRSLTQSLRLYEHCLKLARNIANYSEDCKLLLYAASCNLAHIYCRKGERSRAQALLDDLEEANRLSFANLI